MLSFCNQILIVDIRIRPKRKPVERFSIIKIQGGWPLVKGKIVTKSDLTKHF